MVFRRWDGIKEFEHMRQTLKSAERFAAPARVVSPIEGDAVVRSGYSIAADAVSSPATSDQKVRTEKTVSQVASTSAQQPSEEYSSIVSSGSTWQGSLKIEDSVRIEGKVTGEIDARNTVYVAEGANVDAKVRASFVVIAGQFQGEVTCGERLEILPTGRVKAQLTTKSLVVREGAFIDGQIRMTNERPASNAHPVSILEKMSNKPTATPEPTTINGHPPVSATSS